MSKKTNPEKMAQKRAAREQPKPTTAPMPCMTFEQAQRLARDLHLLAFSSRVTRHR